MPKDKAPVPAVPFNVLAANIGLPAPIPSPSEVSSGPRLLSRSRARQNKKADKVSTTDGQAYANERTTLRLRACADHHFFHAGVAADDKVGKIYLFAADEAGDNTVDLKFSKTGTTCRFSLVFALDEVHFEQDDRLTYTFTVSGPEPVAIQGTTRICLVIDTKQWSSRARKVRLPNEDKNKEGATAKNAKKEAKGEAKPPEEPTT